MTRFTPQHPMLFVLSLTALLLLTACEERYSWTELHDIPGCTL